MIRNTLQAKATEASTIQYFIVFSVAVFGQKTENGFCSWQKRIGECQFYRNFLKIARI